MRLCVLAVSVKKVGPGKYQIRINRIDPKTGRKVNRKLTIEGTKDDAESAYAQLRGEVVATTSKPQRMRLAQYAVSWLERRELRDTTRRRYVVSLTNILPVLGDYFLDALTPDLIQDYVNRRLKTAESYTVLNELRLLRTMAKDAHAARLATMVFTDRVKAPAVSHYTKSDPNRLTPEQFVATVKHLDPVWVPMAWLMVTTGLRWGEASALHRTDIRLWKVIEDEKEVIVGEATISWNNDLGNLVEKGGTKGIERTVPLAPEVVAILQPLIARAGSGPIFTNKNGKIFKSPANFNRKLYAAEKAAGVPYQVSVHGLRRTWQNIARHHTSREALKAIGGWSTDEMLEHYTFVDMDEKHAAARSVINTLNIPPSVSTASQGKEPKKT